MKRRTFLGSVLGTGIAMFDACPGMTRPSPIVVSSDVAVMTLDPDTLAVQQQYPPHRRPWPGRALLVGRFGATILRADSHYERGRGNTMEISALGKEDRVLLVLDGSGSFSKLDDGRFAYIRYIDNLVDVRGIDGATSQNKLAIHGPADAASFAGHVAIASASGVTLYDPHSFRSQRSIALAQCSQLAAHNDRLIVVHARRQAVSVLSRYLEVRRTVSTEMAVGSIVSLDSDRLVVSSSTCDVSRGNTAVYDIPSGRIVWQTDVATAPYALLEHGDVLLVGDNGCGGDVSGVVYALDVHTGRVVHRVELPSSGVGNMLA